MILKTIANIGEYKKESIGMVISPEPNPKKPRINPENKITIISISKFLGTKLKKFSIYGYKYRN